MSHVKNMSPISVGDKVNIERLIVSGWCIDSYNRETNTVTYLSPDGKLNAVFEDGCDDGIVGENK